MRKSFIPMLALCGTALWVAGCGGSGSNFSLPAGGAPSSSIQRDAEAGALQYQAAPNASAPAASGTPAPIQIYYGHVIGLDNTFSPVDGDGGSGNTIDGVPCDNGAIPYHFHAHVSLLINGNRLAIPDAIGLHYPGVEGTNGLTFATLCYYHLHTHDATGLIHIEASVPTTFTLGQLFAVWGQPLSSTNVAGYSGTVKAYTATAASPGYLKQTGAYSPYTGDLQALQFASHQEIVLEVGPTFVDPANLPAIIFPTYQ
ncbi:MAG: hypothetical protein M3Z14_05425 [Candidatus Eremiobacteraeota bacterium]|nr:hypothetical protein [Candidatus Eremiobacteraeota bacterium]